jgi:hypothetical protein
MILAGFLAVVKPLLPLPVIRVLYPGFYMALGFPDAEEGVAHGRRQHAGNE